MRHRGRSGERGHYDREAKVVRCGSCGLPVPTPPGTGEVGTGAVREEAPARMSTRPRTRPVTPSCDDCGRPLKGHDLVTAEDGTALPVCSECVQLDVMHVVGVPGRGARQEHARRVQRRETRVRTRHPRLGGLILALAEEPQHTAAWKTGAVGEEEFGRRLSGIAEEGIKVLHDRKRPGSSANIDHLAVTSQGVLVIDAKKHQGKIRGPRSRALLAPGAGPVRGLAEPDVERPRCAVAGRGSHDGARRVGTNLRDQTGPRQRRPGLRRGRVRALRLPAAGRGVDVVGASGSGPTSPLRPAARSRWPTSPSTSP